MTLHPDTTFIQVSGNHISRTGERDISLYGTRTINPRTALYQHLSLVEKEADRIHTNPPDRLVKGVEETKQQILSLFPEDKQPELSGMKVYFVEFSDLNTLLGHEQNSTRGIAPSGADFVIVAYDRSRPDYVSLLCAVHELVHAWCEKNTIIFSRRSQHNIPSSHRKIEEVVVARGGLNVRRIMLGTNSGRVEKANMTESILSEMLAWFTEKLVWDKLLSDSKLSALFHDEMSARDEWIKSLSQRTDWSAATIPIRDGDAQYNVSVSKQYLFPVSNGESNQSLSPYTMELVNFFQSKYNLPPDFDLYTDLLSASQNPREQNKLRKRFDEVFGKGFYYRLKTTDATWQSILQMLIDFQI